MLQSTTVVERDERHVHSWCPKNPEHLAQAGSAFLIHPYGLPVSVSVGLEMRILTSL